MIMKIGRYEVVGEIGRGGMATVYEAQDPVFNRRVAIKMLPAELLHDPSFRTRFEREAKTIATLEHAAIVPVYDFGEHEGQPYFVMRLMSGKSLADRLVQGLLSLPEIVQIVSRVASALDEAHSKDIVHRDLKPGNILFDSHGEPFLADFGISKLSQSATTLTGNAIVGTPAYMSPEQGQGEQDIDQRSDIYSLGIIVFEMLTGRVPFEADTPMGQVLKHITDTPPSILELNKDLPPAVAEVVERAIAKRKFARYDTAGQMARALAEAAQEDHAAKAPPPTVADLPASAFSANSSSVRKYPTPSPRSVTKPPTPRPARNPSTPAPGSVTPPMSLVKDSVYRTTATKARQKSPKQIIGLFLLGILILGILGGTIYFATQVLEINVKENGASSTNLVDTSIPTLPLAEVHTATVQPLGTPTPPEATAVFTKTPAVAATSTPIPSPTSTPTVTRLIIGGADKIAFVKEKEIWVANLDGTDLRQITSSGSSKSALQWTPDGQAITYITGRSVRIVNSVDLQDKLIINTNWADYLAAFEISPDGKYVAFSMSDGLFILPYDLNTLSQIRTPDQLKSAQNCLTFNSAKTRLVRWSADGKRLAVVITGTQNNKQVDLVRVFQLGACGEAPTRIDEFPGARFTIRGYDANPTIQSLGWDGSQVLALNVNNNFGFGDIYIYNLASGKAQNINPLGTLCCFRDFQWSPDGTYFLFSFKDNSQPQTTQLYLVDYATIGTGVIYKPIALPEDVFTNLDDKPMPVLRPAR
jgi:serine/threonine protein kinase/Tol biopolymer transport system component